MVKNKVLEEYLTACKEADLYNFKTDVRLRRIFEHCSNEIAANYLNEITLHSPGIFKIAFTNDNYGRPKKHFNYSNSTLQYIGVLSNLIREFSSLDGLRICEIGGGYGGQCRTIYDVFKPACYHLIDLPEVSQLQSRYLQGFKGARFLTAPTGEEYDLVISNYALSEIIDNKVYIDQVCLKSKHGYITCNTDFVQPDWHHKRMPDIKGEKQDNYILIW